MFRLRRVLIIDDEADHASIDTNDQDMLEETSDDDDYPRRPSAITGY